MRLQSLWGWTAQQFDPSLEREQMQIATAETMSMFDGPYCHSRVPQSQEGGSNLIEIIVGSTITNLYFYNNLCLNITQAMVNEVLDSKRITYNMRKKKSKWVVYEAWWFSVMCRSKSNESRESVETNKITHK